MAKTIKASFGSKCPISMQTIYPGERICRYTQSLHKACIAKTATVTSKPYDVCEKIVNEARGKLIGRWCKESAVNSVVLTTRSGRIIRKPTDELKRTFVKGSRFVGCDTYDRAFNGHFIDSDHGDTDDEDEEPTAEDQAFINDEPQSPTVTADNKQSEEPQADEAEEQEDEEEEEEEEWETDEDEEDSEDDYEYDTDSEDDA